MIYKQISNQSGCSFYYYEFGSSNKKVLLFLPGYADSALMYLKLGKSLAQNYRIIALDLPMIYDNSQFYDVEKLKDYLTLFVKTMKLERFTLVGFSSCGMVAIDYAYENPIKVEELILLNSVPRFILLSGMRILYLGIKPFLLIRPVLFLYSRINTNHLVRRLFKSPHISKYTRERMRMYYYSVFGTAVNLLGSSLVEKFKKLRMVKKTVFFNDDTIIPWERYQNFVNRLGGELIVFSKGLHAEKRIYWEKLKSLWLKSPKIDYQNIKVEKEE